MNPILFHNTVSLHYSFIFTFILGVHQNSRNIVYISHNSDSTSFIKLTITTVLHGILALNTQNFETIVQISILMVI